MAKRGNVNSLKNHSSTECLEAHVTKVLYFVKNLANSILVWVSQGAKTAKHGFCTLTP